MEGQKHNEEKQVSCCADEERELQYFTLVDADLTHVNYRENQDEICVNRTNRSPIKTRRRHQCKSCHVINGML